MLYLRGTSYSNCQENRSWHTVGSGTFLLIIPSYIDSSQYPMETSNNTTPTSQDTSSFTTAPLSHPLDIAAIECALITSEDVRVFTSLEGLAGSERALINTEGSGGGLAENTSITLKAQTQLPSTIPSALDSSANLTVPSGWKIKGRKKQVTGNGNENKPPPPPNPPKAPSTPGAINPSQASLAPQPTTLQPVGGPQK
ncbi:hypothetical protein OBBRIDRAFT_790336 [Obba rivulosa]|uniref:Uncharacterized protein n=1 Tax=Obba rivulosa TaxID=1052685 RepID=A0A8E2J2H9_9APHY|nr:hypothetical protein OBBRIDRAFT_790336 [Obba rivulosa]